MVFIIDGNHLACRCFFAIDALMTSYGKSTNAIYGFVTFLRSFIKRFGVENHYFIAWDSRSKTWRHELYPEYKLGRKKFPDHFYEQLDDIREIIKILGISQYKIESIEADDIIGTLTYKARKNRQRVIIVSSDHDFEQLISNNVKVLSPSLAQSKEKLKDYDFVVNKYNLEPKQLIDYMALCGDSSDNVLGIPGFGPKTVTNLLKANENLDNILINVNNLKILNKKNILIDASKNIKKKISDNLDTILLSKKLVTINCLLDIEPVFIKNTLNLGKLIVYFRKLEFMRLLNNLQNWKSVF